jgi:hypothetical protein
MQRRRWERMHALYEQALKQDGFLSDMRIENQGIKSLIATLALKCFGKLLEFYGIQRKEHEMKSETKAMICTAAVLIAMGIFKELAAVCLITAVAFEEGVKKFDR